MTLDATEWTDAALAEFDGAVALRRAIHADPEIGLNTPRTTDKVRTALAGLPLELRQGRSTTGLVAILRGGGRQGEGASNHRTVLLRGDMDALPMHEETGLPFASRTAGAMHACGHDSHTAMLVGAARALAARRDDLPGTVVFMFQPGEEGHHGARYMIDDGLLDNPAHDAAFALHVSPNLPAGQVVGRSGPIMASADTLHAVITGRGGHAAMPHDGLDPIPVACEIVLALQTLITRQVPVTDPAVLSITKIEAGSAHNVVPGEVGLLGTLRTLSEPIRHKLHAAFPRMVEHIAAAHGLSGTAHVEPGYPVTVNDAHAVDLVATCAGSAFVAMPAPMMGAEDFSYVLRRTPGAMTFLGAAPVGTDPAINPPLHNTRMAIDENIMAQGIALHCATAMRFLERGFG